MNEIPRSYAFDELVEGMTVSLTFSISQNDMEVFAQLSGDRSQIHHDAEFAATNGFDGPVVYGALTVAKLSHLVGMHLPGDLGLATSWKIEFNRPLYVEQEARFDAELVHISPATQTVLLKFTVVAGERRIASGTAGSMLLKLPSDDRGDK